MGEIVNNVPVQADITPEIVDVETTYPATHLEGEVHDSIGDLVPHYAINLGNHVTASLPKDAIELGTIQVGDEITKSFTITATVNKNVRLAVNYDDMKLDKVVLTPEELAAGATVSMTFVPRFPSRQVAYGPIVVFYDELMGLRVKYNVNVVEATPAVFSIEPTSLPEPEFIIKPANMNVTMYEGAEPVVRYINVSGSNMTEEVNFSVDTESVTLNPTTLSAEDINAGTRISVSIAPNTLGYTQATITNSFNDFTTTVNSTVMVTPKFSMVVSDLPDSFIVGEVVEQVIEYTSEGLQEDVIIEIMDPENCNASINDSASIVIPKESTNGTIKIQVDAASAGAVLYNIANSFNGEIIVANSVAIEPTPEPEPDPEVVTPDETDEGDSTPDEVVEPTEPEVEA